ncbi:MAG: TerB family tellurite resistance protein [Deltaproteobacteria bacterium]|nr:TerB family tellurite resistance protein [Deltaproteobacteria bacterium]MBN2674417.1 TerB family tellurite resistance protein [Deltaproteobacteria bacterium]
MLTEEKKSILQLLVALAWADGKVDQEELEIVVALTDAFQASKEECDEVLEWAKTPRTLDDVDISALAQSDVYLALQHGVLLTYIDGEQTADEVELINKLVVKLGLTQDEAQPLLDSAAAFAQNLLPELES